MTLPFSLPDWVPWWVQSALLVAALVMLLAFALMPFATFGVKGRLDALDGRLDDLQLELRALGARLAERGSAGMEDSWLPPVRAPAVPAAPGRAPIPPPPRSREDSGGRTRRADPFLRPGRDDPAQHAERDAAPYAEREDAAPGAGRNNAVPRARRDEGWSRADENARHRDERSWPSSGRNGPTARDDAQGWPDAKPDPQRPDIWTETRPDLHPDGRAKLGDVESRRTGGREDGGRSEPRFDRPR